MRIRLAVAVAAAAVAWGACGGDGGAGQASPSDEAGAAATDAAAGDASPADASPARPDLAWPPGEPGPYRAGYRRLSVTYAPAGYEGERTFALSLWYPTEAATGAPAKYLDGLWTDDQAFLDAPLAPPAAGATYPLHVHSHGHQGFAGSSPDLMRHFATHGWVVAAPDHTGKTLTDLLSPRPTWMYFVRALDLSATLDALRDLPAEDPLAGRLDPSRAVLSGHSFGGYTAFGACGASFDVAALEADCPGPTCSEAELDVFRAGVADPRFVACLPMAAGNRALYGDAGFATVAAPVLMLTGDQDTDVPNATEGDPIWAALAGTGALRVDIAGGCHHTFGLGGCDGLDDAEGFLIVDTYAMAFARYHLLGDEGVAPILAGTVARAIASSGGEVGRGVDVDRDG